jgi:Ca2+-binding EF-hand superfamily protein
MVASNLSQSINVAERSVVKALSPRAMSPRARPTTKSTAGPKPRPIPRKSTDKQTTKSFNGVGRNSAADATVDLPPNSPNGFPVVGHNQSIDSIPFSAIEPLQVSPARRESAISSVISSMSIFNPFGKRTSIVSKLPDSSSKFEVTQLESNRRAKAIDSETKQAAKKNASASFVTVRLHGLKAEEMSNLVTGRVRAVISAHGAEETVEIFRRFDLLESSTLNAVQLRAALEKIGLSGANEDSLTTMISAFYPQGRGLIDYHNFVDDVLNGGPSFGLSNNSISITTKQMSLSDTTVDEAVDSIRDRLRAVISERGTRGMLDIFQETDTDMNGKIDAAEFKASLAKFNVKGASDEVVYAFFASADPDGNGALDYREFVSKVLDWRKIPKEYAAASKPASRKLGEFVAVMEPLHGFESIINSSVNVKTYSDVTATSSAAVTSYADHVISAENINAADSKEITEYTTRAKVENQDLEIAALQIQKSTDEMFECVVDVRTDKRISSGTTSANVKMQKNYAAEIMPASDYTTSTDEFTNGEADKRSLEAAALEFLKFAQGTWEEAFDSATGQKYYFNEVTSETSWEMPDDYQKQVSSSDSSSSTSSASSSIDSGSETDDDDVAIERAREDFRNTRKFSILAPSGVLGAAVAAAVASSSSRISTSSDEVSDSDAAPRPPTSKFHRLSALEIDFPATQP